MEISGSQKINVPQDKAFQALLNPEVLKNSFPNCPEAGYEDTPAGRLIKLVITPTVPGFKGPYNIYLEPKEVTAPTHMVIYTEPTSGVGSVKATCNVDLAADGAGTTITYSANAELTGAIAAAQLLIKPALQGALKHFFSNFEKQANAIA
ncbi:MAG TPA: SRPBCC domain-containing protein [Dictyobacter sp.]|jgi:carbon monoxide dehydrogenase subunit G|nr:SRPBCC domain-containing protein [Dictyobacter sp.]